LGKNTIRKTLKILGLFLAVILLLLILLSVSLLIPRLQLAAARQAQNWFNTTYQTQLHLEGFQYKFPNTVCLHQVWLEDNKQDTLLSAHALTFNFRSFSRSTKTLNTGPVAIEGFKFKWLKHRGQDSTNLQRFIAHFKSAKPKDSLAPKFKMNVPSLQLKDGSFLYADYNCQDCPYYDLKQLNLKVKEFALKGSYFNTQILDLNFIDDQGLHLKKLNADLSFEAQGMALQNLAFRTNLSELRGNVALGYQSLSDFKDFVNQVKMQVNFEYGYLASADIQYFAPAFPNFKTFTIRGSAQGIVNNLTTKDLDLTLGKGTRLRANIRLKNTTRPKQLFLATPNLKLKSTPTDVRYIASLFSDTALPAALDKLGPMRLTGSYRGYLTNFSAKGKFSSEALKFNTQIQLENPNKPNKLRYNGRVNLEELDLAALSENKELGQLKANLSLQGKGIDPVSMQTSIAGSIKRFDFKGYQYSGMKVNGRIEEGEFKGNFKATDPNLQFNFNGQASFSSDTSIYDFVMLVDKANFHELKLVKDSISTFTGLVNMDFTAVDYDQWSGEIKLQDFSYEDSRSAHFFKEVKIVSRGLGLPKVLEVESEILNAKLSGDYTFKGMGQIFKNAYKRINPVDTTSVIAVKENFNFYLELAKPELLTNLFLPKLHVEPGTSIKGNFLEEDQALAFELKSKGLRYGSNIFMGVDLTLKNGQTKSDLEFTLAEIDLASGYIIDSIALDNYYQNDTLKYQLTGIIRDSIDSRINLNGFAIQKGQRSFVIGTSNSFFNIGYSRFKIPKGGLFFIDSNRYYVQDFEITNGPEKVFVNGALSKSDNEVLRVHLEGFGMELLNYFLSSDKTRFKGKLQGDLIATKLLAKPKFITNLYVDSLNLNETLLGNLTLTTDYSLVNDTITIDSDLTLGERTTLLAKGFYQTDSSGSIGLDVNFNGFRLAALNPVVSVVANNLRGMVNGDLSIKGKTKAPDINGRLFLPKVAFTVSFLQTDYNLVKEPYVDITSTAIRFPMLRLKDTKFGTNGSLDGQITHKNFSDFNLDLVFNTNQLLVLNTQPDENNAYYGTAFATGLIKLKGAPDDLKVSANVATERNTNFNIPIGGATEVKRSGFVKFVSPQNAEDSLAILSKQFDIDKGITLEFDIEVKPNAQVSIILDQSTGNALNASGTGQIKLKLNPAGEMELYGTYTVARGVYNFNIEGLLNKKFKVERGGTVNWNGDPYEAQLNLTALYSTRANPQPFLGDVGGGNTLTEVYLNITGPLTNPQINFDIKTPRASSTVQALLNNRLRDKETMNQQVFSILAFNAFTPQSNIMAGSGGGINQWDIIANQAAAYLNRFTGGYELSLGYQQNTVEGNVAGTDNSEIEVGVSKDFLNERLTISSSVGVPLNGNQGNLAGDFEITYSFTEDGRFRAKAFNRAVDNDFNISLGRQQLYQQGVGLNYQVDFDNLQELWTKVLEKDNPNSTAVKEEEPKPKNDD
jgi:hypothetical protein